jgi:hypothetical protein
VSSFPGGALAGAARRSEIFRHQRLDLIVGDRRYPGVRSSARPWTHRMFMTPFSSAARQPSASMPASGSRPTACSNR